MMIRIKQFMAGIVTILATIGAGSAARADQIFTDRAAFLANVQPGYYLETFDDLGFFEPSPIAFSKNSFSYTASADGDFINDRGWLATNFPLTDPIVFNFTSGNVTAVGGFFFATDFVFDVIPGTIVVTLDNGISITLNDPLESSFVGFTTSLPISSLTVMADTPPFILQFPTANDLIVGAAIPEPSTLLLAELGWAGSYSEASGGASDAQQRGNANHVKAFFEGENT